jgi:hypothetical protein
LHAATKPKSTDEVMINIRYIFLRLVNVCLFLP